MAKLVPAFLVGGCSLIYNPSNIEKQHDGHVVDMDFPVDVEIRADAMPRDLTISEAFPTTVDEGSGTGGSRNAIVVLKGHNFVKDAAANLQVTLTPATAGAATLASFEVAGNGDFIALDVNVPVDTACADGTTVDVDVTVMQNDLMGGTISQSLAKAFAVRCLDELDTAPASASALKPLYSRIDVSGGIDFPAGVAPAALLRSASSINLGAVDVSATGQEPGPGGGRGGDHEVNAVPATGPKPGATGSGSGGGGGGGYVVAGGSGTGTGAGGGGGATGDVWISSYAASSSSGGGGGGDPLTLGTGGVGGGGGGTLELTAPGTITVGAITARGGDPTNNSGTAGGDGGAGTGGTVLIRAGATLTASTVSVIKGTLPSGSNGGAGSDGRVRADAAAGTYPGAASRGPMFVSLPTRTTNQMFNVDLRGTANDMTSTMRVFDKTGLPVAMATYTPLFGTEGTAVQQVVLKAGYNRVCVWVAGGSPDVPESLNCQVIAYLPP